MFPLFYSDEFLDHDTGPGHPERADRLRAIVAHLRGSALAADLQWREPMAIAGALERRLMAAVQRVHDGQYLDDLQQLAERGGGRIDADTPMSPRSYAVALLAVQAWLEGFDAVRRSGKPAFVLARPPGHHAVADGGMGFCLLSNAAIVARDAIATEAVERIAIVDWDVHHGNGTQDLVVNEAAIAYCSIHQSPAYPGTGYPCRDDHEHQLLNLPVAAGSTIEDYRSRFRDRIVPFLKDFRPDVILVSAGYDANRTDPLASVNLAPEDYGELTHYLLDVTPRLLFGLEGGYDLNALAASVEATISACISRDRPQTVPHFAPNPGPGS
ncbi:MAG: histone deacetylase [Cyanophyceae cyanobacterium]